MKYKMDENTGKRWLSRRGGDIKGMGVGYTMNVTFDAAKVRSNAKDADKAYLSKKHGKGSR
jgi:hypothetical protein